jgi:cytochrome c-type biogenesis protein CcmH
MKGLLALLLLAAIGMLPVPALAESPAGAAEAETLQTVERIPVRLESEEDVMVRQLSGDLRCAVCQSESVADSNSALARSMRDLIREQVRLGKSREEIHDYFVSKYGEYILMEPRKTGANWILWLLPFALLSLGAAAILLRSRKQSFPQAGKPAGQTDGERGMDPPAPADSKTNALIESLRAPLDDPEKE